MQATVGTTAVSLGTKEDPDSFAAGQVIVLQNLGPGDIYFDFDENLTVGTGMKLAIGGAYELPRTANEVRLFLVASEENTDLRYVLVD